MEWYQPPQNTQLYLHPPNNNSQVFTNCGGRIVFPAGEVCCEHSSSPGCWEIYQYLGKSHTMREVPPLAPIFGEWRSTWPCFLVILISLFSFPGGELVNMAGCRLLRKTDSQKTATAPSRYLFLDSDINIPQSGLLYRLAGLGWAVSPQKEISVFPISPYFPQAV